MPPVIVTTTFYRSTDDVRFHLARQMVQAARAEGYAVFIVDDSPVQVVRDLLRIDGAYVMRQNVPGMGAARRQVLSAALSSFDEIVWTEPEKAPLIPLLRPAIDRLKTGAYLVIPRRQSLDSYPAYQHFCELRGNWAVASMTGRPDLDLWFGPRVMSRFAADTFVAYDGSYGDRWDSIFVPVARLIATCGKRVTSKPVNYIHPPQQTLIETGDDSMNAKRDQQLNELVEIMGMECAKLGLRGQ